MSDGTSNLGAAPSAQHEEVPHAEDTMSAASFVQYQHVWVVFLRTGDSGTKPPANMRISIPQNSKYRDIQNEVNEKVPGQWTLLQGHYGPQPYWTIADLAPSINPTHQTLYAIDTTGNSMEYVLALVRGPDLDYPLPIFEQPQRPPAYLSRIKTKLKSLLRTKNAEDSNAPGTIWNAIIGVDPSLTRKKVKLVANSYDFNATDLRAKPFSHFLSEKTGHEGTPPAFVITLDSRPAKFLLDVPPNSIPPFLRIPIVNCKDLLQRSYKLELFSLQLIHLSSALLHSINLLGQWLQPGGEKEQVRATDNRLFGLLLAEKLQEHLNDLDAIVEKGESGSFDQDEIPKTTTRILEDLCGEHPGAMAIRDTFHIFTNLKVGDKREASANPPASRRDPDTPPPPIVPITPSLTHQQEVQDEPKETLEVVRHEANPEPEALPAQAGQRGQPSFQYSSTRTVTSTVRRTTGTVTSSSSLVSAARTEIRRAPNSPDIEAIHTLEVSSSPTPRRTIVTSHHSVSRITRDS